MYSASYEDRATTLCLVVCQVTGLPAREDDPTCALPAVDVAAHVGIAVADQLGRPFFMLGVVEPMALRPRHVPKHTFDGDEVIFTWCLHETTEIPDRKRKVWSGVQQVVECSDNTPVSRGIHDLSSARLAQFEPALYRRRARIARDQPAAIEELAGVRCLAEEDAIRALLHFNSELI
jgi:hypothetical protein